MFNPYTNKPQAFRIHSAATMYRAQYMGELVADGILWITNKIKAIGRWLQPVPPLAECKTAEDVLNYAQSIRKTQPAFADELIAAANRHQ